MNYYRINNSIDSKVVGRGYPQVNNAIYPTTYDSPNALHKLKYAEKIDNKTEIPKAVLHKSGKITDLLNAGFFSGPILISKKLKEILAASNTMGVQFVSTSLYVKEVEDTNFYIVYPHISDYTFLDVKESEFLYKDPFLKEIISTVTFNTVEEYLAAMKKNIKDAIGLSFPTTYTPLVTNKIAIEENCGIDFFSITKCSGGIGFFVSENLKNIIEEANCTGIVFTEVNEIHP
jgi:hypothetical protein